MWRLQAGVARARGDLPGAVALLSRAAALARGQGSAHTLAEVERDLGVALKASGDPKDKIVLYNLLKQAGLDSVEGRIDAGIAKVRQALAADPEIVEAYTMLGNMNAKAKRPALRSQ